MGAGSAHVTRSAGALARATLDNGIGWMPTDPPIVGDNRTQVNAGAGRGDDAAASGTTVPGPHKQKRPGRPGRLRNIVVGGTGFEPVTPTMSR